MIDALLALKSNAAQELFRRHSLVAVYLYELRLRHRYEEFCHIQGFFVRALKEKLGVS